MREKVKVLYITGSGRSGSTLLESMLGQINGFFAGGEMCFIWDRGFIENRLCGCGSSFNDCELWQEIIKNAFGNDMNIDPMEMWSYYSKGARFHQIPLMLMPWSDRNLRYRLEDYIKNLEKLYSGIKTVTGANIIIDSSKFPSYGYILSLIESIELKVIHLIRDSRAVAHSWKKRKVYQPGIDMYQIGSLRSALQWNILNYSAEAFWRSKKDMYIQIRYEDFIQEPRKTINQILNFEDMGGSRLPFYDENLVRLNENHIISGNPSRYKRGLIELRIDDEWKHSSKFFDNFITTIMTFPALLQYGYRL